jgi:hypothetical protein
VLISEFQNILNISASTTAGLIGDAAFIKLISQDGKTLNPMVIYHSQQKVASLLFRFIHAEK